VFPRGVIEKKTANYSKPRSLPGYEEESRSLLNSKKKPLIMGVVNCTPDSFSDGGLYLQTERAVSHAISLLEAGADILDIGGESTRPFSEPVDLEEEKSRVIPVIEEIRKRTKALISVDTQKAEVARAALSIGADIVNDVSALRADPEMAEVIKDFKCLVCLMHMKGTPRDMQLAPSYDDCVKEVYDFLEERLNYIESLGISREMAIVDPGIGFGKRLDHNLELLANLDYFRSLGAKVLIGVSRKSFLGEITGIKDPKERDIPTLGAVAWSVIRGADIVRVHNVDWTRRILQVIEALMEHVRNEEHMSVCRK